MDDVKRINRVIDDLACVKRRCEAKGIFIGGFDISALMKVLRVVRDEFIKQKGGGKVKCSPIVKRKK